MEIIIHAFISSQLDYYNSLFTCLKKSAIDQLQSIKNAAARLLTRSGRMTHITPILHSLHWLPVKFRIHFKIIVVTYKSLHGQAPVYILELLHPYVTTRSRRSSDQELLVVPCARLKTKGDCAFDVVALILWNALLIDLYHAVSVDAFKKQLKTHLFKLAFVLPILM